MGRGPSYPYVGLEESIGLAQKMYDFTKRASAPIDAIVKDAWKYSPTSSSGQKVLAALKAFGLVEDGQASSGNPSIRLSNRSIRILLDDQNSDERKEEIRKAALSPKWYEYCWKTWGKEMPASMKSNLMIEHGFVDTTVDGFLKDYRRTIAFAGLLSSPQFGESTESDDVSGTVPKIGDYVQWESNGILKMPEARKLIRIDEDFAFVDGYLSGIPAAELIAAEAPPPKQQNAITTPLLNPIARTEADSKMQTETFALPEGVTGQLQWPSQMSADAFADFIYQLEGLKTRVGRAVRKEKVDVASSPAGDVS